MWPSCRQHVLCVAGAMLPAIVKMLRTLKATEDATAEPATQSIYLLCDMALAIAAAIMDAHSPGATTVAKHPGSVVFPKGFFRLLGSSRLKGCSPFPLLLVW